MTWHSFTECITNAIWIWKCRTAPRMTWQKKRDWLKLVDLVLNSIAMGSLKCCWDSWQMTNSTLGKRNKIKQSKLGERGSLYLPGRSSGGIRDYGVVLTAHSLRPGPSPLGREDRLQVVGVWLGVEGAGRLFRATTSQQAWSSFRALFPALITLNKAQHSHHLTHHFNSWYCWTTSKSQSIVLQIFGNTGNYIARLSRQKLT